jgi:hypothetical protein
MVWPLKPVSPRGAARSQGSSFTGHDVAVRGDVIGWIVGALGGPLFLPERYLISQP